MTAIIIPRRHITQPQGRVTIAPEWADQGLVWAYLPRSDHGLTPVGALQYVEGEAGFAASPNGTTYEWGLRSLSIPSNDCALIALATRRNTTSANSRIVSLTTSGANPILSIGVWPASGGGLMGFIRDAAGTTQSFDNQESAGQWLANRPTFMSFSRSLAGNYTRLRNHNSVEQTTCTNIANVAWDRITIGALYRTSPVSQFNGEIYLGAIFAKTLSLDQDAALFQNPWQIFKADPVRIYSLPPVLSIPTLSGASFAGRIPSVTLTY